MTIRRGEYKPPQADEQDVELAKMLCDRLSLELAQFECEVARQAAHNQKHMLKHEWMSRQQPGYWIELLKSWFDAFSIHLQSSDRDRAGRVVREKRQAPAVLKEAADFLDRFYPDQCDYMVRVQGRYLWAYRVPRTFRLGRGLQEELDDLVERKVLDEESILYETLHADRQREQLTAERRRLETSYAQL